MKRLIGLLFVFAALTFSVQAQQIFLRTNVMQGSYSTATTQTATTEATVDILVAKDYLYYYDIVTDVDSAGDGTDITIRLKGSNDNSNWYNVGSSQAYGVTVDTVMQFTNINVSGNETWVIAEHTQTTAATADYHDYDTTNLTGGVYADTVTVGARVNTVAAQTYTIAKNYPIGYKYLRMSYTGDGAGADCSIASVFIRIVKAEGF